MTSKPPEENYFADINGAAGVAAKRPTLEELRARLERRAPVTPSISPTEVVRAVRDGGGRCSD